MSSSLSPFIPVPRSRLRRLVDDLLLAIVVGLVLGLVISLILGRRAGFFENLLVSVMIGVVAYTLVTGMRLLFWDHANWGWRQWLPFVLVVIGAAPVAHFVGLHLSGWMLGVPLPPLSSYPGDERFRLIAYTLIGTTLAVILGMYRDSLRRTRDEHACARLRAEVIERQALQAQLRLMQAQIEPHMLFNTLANLQGLIALDPDRASEMLDQLIQYLRATLSVSRSETTTLEQEFASMQAYLGLMGVRMGERLAYRLELPPELRTARLPTMLLQPLVENAIVHGLEPKVDGGEVVVTAGVSGDCLAIEVRDTGLGLGQGPARSGGGVGMSTTRERLEVLYGARAAITLSPAAPHGTLARLTLPLETTA